MKAKKVVLLLPIILMLMLVGVFSIPPTAVYAESATLNLGTLNYENPFAKWGFEYAVSATTSDGTLASSTMYSKTNTRISILLKKNYTSVPFIGDWLQGDFIFKARNRANDSVFEKIMAASIDNFSNLTFPNISESNFSSNISDTYNMSMSFNGAANTNYEITIGYTFRQGGNAATIRSDSKSFNFTHDNAAPTVSSTVSNGATTKTPFTVSTSDNASGIKNFFSKSPGTGFSAVNGASVSIGSGSVSGLYEFYAVDHAGHTSAVYKIHFDNKAPTLTLSGVANNGITRSAFTVSVADDYIGLQSFYVKKPGNTYFDTINGATYTVGQSSINGMYEFYAVDHAGNESTHYFRYLDTSSPTLTLSGVANNGFTSGAVVVSWEGQTSGSMDAVTAKYEYARGGTFPTAVGTIGINSGTIFSAEGNYLIRITDTAGNFTDYRFTIDKTAPTAALTGVIDNGFTNGNVQLGWSTAVTGAGGALVNVSDTLTVMYGFSTTSAFSTSITTEYTSGTLLTAEGNYTFRIIDFTGNFTEYRFTIDKTAPTIFLSGVANNGFTNTNVEISWVTMITGAGGALVNVGDALSVMYGFTTTSEFSISLTTEYTKETLLTAEGNYTFRIADFTGNFTDYRFTIDKTAPTLALSGVANNGFTAKTAKATWLDAIGGVGSQRVHKSDTLTVRYAISTNGAFPNTATEPYISAVVFSTEANYLLCIEDAAGNVEEHRFTIDKTAPTAELVGVTHNGFTNMNVELVWSTEVTGVGGTLANGNDMLTVMYSFSSTSAFLTSVDTEYTRGTSLLGEGNYVFRIVDFTGNFTEYRFTIDKTAPTLQFSGIVFENASKDGIYATWTAEANGAGELLTNTKDSIRVQYSHSSMDFPKSTNLPYIKNHLLKAEGYYLIVITDLTGNATEYEYVVDTTAPTVSALDAFTNVSFVYSASDLRTAIIQYKFNQGATQICSTEHFPVEDILDNYGFWEFRAIDGVGNATEWSAVSLYRRDTFGNSVIVKNTYKAVTWYSVRLPSKYFQAAAGTYSFQNYDSAVGFAVEKEVKHRVETLSGGRWSYVNINNESVMQIYEARADLDKAVLKYAKTYVSERNTLSLSGNLYQNPTDEDFITREDALTMQNVVLPEHLIQYAALPLYLIMHKYAFKEPVIGVSGNTRTISLQYLSDGTRPQSSTRLTISYGKDIKSALDEQGAWRQGYYLVTEEDLCRNVETYLVCIDSVAPTMTGEVIYGNGTVGTLTFDKAFTTTQEKVMLYTRLEVQRFIDNLDEFALLKIKGARLDTTYAQQDTVPVLSYENGYFGKYTITLYDRSFNTLEFTVRIAGMPPKMTYTSLTNETKCTLKIVCDDTDNAVVSIRLFKISYEGEHIELFQDDDGLAVALENLSYVIRTGGKYVLRLADVYGREIESDPIFYLKGLPVGSLRGVKEGGVTNTDVTMEFSLSESLTVFVFEGGQWVQNSNVASIVSNERYKIASISASESNSRRYKFFLYSTLDRNLFVEYRFEIDCIAPSVSIVTQSGESLENDSVTKNAFRLTWEEANITVYFYSTSDILGSLGEAKYTKETIITKTGSYLFTISDKVGNKTTRTVTLDNVVSFTIDGNYSQLADGSYISKYHITLTVTERTSSFVCAASNGLKVENGQKLDVDGTYFFTVADLYGNVVNLTVIIDNLPPVPIITTEDGSVVPKDGTTNKPFRVSCAEAEVSVQRSATGARYDVYDGALVNVNGVHYFKMVDRMNNILLFTVTLDRAVAFELKGVYLEAGNNKYISRSGITLSAKETYQSFDVTNKEGISFAVGEKIAIEGVYDVTIADLHGNTVVITLIIDKTAPSVTIVTTAGLIVAVNGKTNSAFTVSCAEEQSTLTYSRSATGFVPYKGNICSETGVYYFTATDLIGNSVVFTVEIDVVVSFSISGSVVKRGNNSYLTRDYLTVNVSEGYLRFEVLSANDIAFLPGEKVGREGIYLVTIEDSAGNIVELTLEVDKTAPTPLIRTESGAEVVQNGKTNQAFTVTSEAGAELFISTDGTRYLFYDGAPVANIGLHYFKITDLAGNQTLFTVTIDIALEYTVKGVYKTLSGARYISQTWISIEIKETLKKFSMTSSSGMTYKLGEQISIEGDYTVTVEDMAGNAAVLEIIIDKTAPVPQIVTEGETHISANSVTNKAFTVSCLESAAQIMWSANGVLYQPHSGDIVRTSGLHYFKIVDLAENNNTFTVRLDALVDFEIKGVFVIDSQGDYISRTGLAIDLKEEYTRFDVTSTNGIKFLPGEKVVVEGRYVVTIEDLGGNVVVLNIRIDLTAPTVYAQTAEGKSVEINGATNAAFRVGSEEENTRITVSTNGMTFVDYDGALRSAVGKYHFEAYDLVGNKAAFSVTLDNAVNFSIKGEFKKTGEYTYLSRTGVAILVGETHVRFEVKSSNEITFIPGETVTAEGEYMVTIEDTASNVVTLIVVIDLTPPVAQILLETGREIQPNTSTNLPFKIVCAEEGSVIHIIRAAGKQEVYFGDFVRAQGKYTFNVSDLIGNSVAIVVTLDTGVDFLLKGSFVEYEPNKFASRYTPFFEMKEDYVRFDVTSKEGISFAVGEKITEEGEYTVVIEDVIGNAVTVIVLIDRQAPIITLSGVVAGGATNTDVSINALSEFATLKYSIYGASGAQDATIGMTFNKEGDYTILARDYAGNEGKVTFKIDKKLDITISQLLVQDSLIVGDVSFVFSEKLAEQTLVKDGTELGYRGGKISEAGRYMLTVTDLVGNTAEYRWQILQSAAKEYRITVPENTAVVVEKNGSTVSAIQGSEIVLTENGEYALYFESEAGAYSIKVTVDTVPPAVTITQEKGQFVLSAPNKSNVTLELYKNGAKVACDFGKAITAAGDYRLVVTDELGNVTEYEISLHYVNGFGIALICIGAVALVLALGIVVLTRRRQRLK